MDKSDPLDPIWMDQIRTEREREIVGRNRSRSGGATLADGVKVTGVSEKGPTGHDLMNRGHGMTRERWRSRLGPLHGRGTARAVTAVAGVEKSSTTHAEMALEATVRLGNRTT